MLHIVYEGTPEGTIPVAPLLNTSGNPVYWEAGAIGMIDANGRGTVSDGTAAFGVLADRRSPNPGISMANFLPDVINGDIYGSESLFNQPGHGNALFGTVNGVNSIIPSNTVPTTTNLRDETATNPNLTSRYVTMYIRGGVYATDQFDGTKTYVPGTTLYVDTVAGRLTTSAATGIAVGVCLKADNGYGFVEFKSTLV